MSRKGPKPPRSLDVAGTYRYDRKAQIVQIDSNHLRMPTKIFAAQLCCIETIGNASIAYFAQVVPRRRVVSVVGIQMNDSALPDFHRTLTDDFRRSLRALVPDASEDLSLHDADFTGLPHDRTVTFTANLARLAITSQGAQIDWYELGPWQLRQLQRNEHPDAPGAVITICLSNALVDSFIRQIDKNVDVVRRPGAPPVTPAAGEENRT